MIHAEDPTSADRVRRSTASDVNREIDRQTYSNIRRYANSSPEVINKRIEELDKEWDVERALEVDASTLGLDWSFAWRNGQQEMAGVTNRCTVIPAPARASGMVPGCHYLYCGARVYVRGAKSTGKNMS